MKISEAGEELPDPPKPPVEPIPAPIQPSPDPIEQKPVPKSPDLIQPDAPQVSPYFSRPPQPSATAKPVAPEPQTQTATMEPPSPPLPPSPPSSPPAPDEPDPLPASQPLPPPFTYSQSAPAAAQSQSDTDQGLPPMAPTVSAELPLQGDGPSGNPSSQAMKVLQRTVNELRRDVALLWAQLRAPERRPVSGTSEAIRYGVATATWASGNTIVLKPCRSFTDATPTGESNVSAVFLSPTGAVPKKLVVNSGDVIAFDSPADDNTRGYIKPVLVKFDSVTVAADPTTASGVPTGFSTTSAVTGLTNGSASASGGISANGSCDGNGNVTLTGTVTITIGGVITGASGTDTVLKAATGTTSVITGFSNTPLVLRAPSGW